MAVATGKSALVLKLHGAQLGLCFHCGLPMKARGYSAAQPLGWTKEHIFPRGSLGKGVGHNFVLAHRPCNMQRGNQPPTSLEISRTVRLYAEIGRQAFSMTSIKVRKLIDDALKPLDAQRA